MHIPMHDRRDWLVSLFPDASIGTPTRWHCNQRVGAFCLTKKPDISFGISLNRVQTVQVPNLRQLNGLNPARVPL